MLKIYNSLTQQKEIFTPIKPNEISIYVCGMTVYDYCHIGHARSMIVFDVVVRYLRDLGYNVTFVRNITDIDDKIIKRAHENDEPISHLTTRFIQAMHEDASSLGLLMPDHEPRATEYVPQMINLITQLLDQQAAYVADNGDVYFDVRHFAQYGKLSHLDLDKMKVGVRIEVNDVKRDPLDFILWKMAKPGEPKWPSPWGEGRPGWHIECSVMSTNLLGQPFDIHGGGLDLKFPHHENEIAQSEAACQHDFANTWMHAGLLQVNNEKMSKSLGNYFTIRDVLAQYCAETVRYFMLAANYRSPVNYSVDNLSQAHSALSRLYLALLDLPPLPEVDLKTAVVQSYVQQFRAKMNDDFNTPDALAVLFEVAHQLQRVRQLQQMDEALALAGLIKYFGSLFGILQCDPQLFLQGSQSSQQEVAEIERLIALREQARSDKNWQQADQVRKQLQEMGITIEDSDTGTRWRRIV